MLVMLSCSSLVDPFGSRSNHALKQVVSRASFIGEVRWYVLHRARLARVCPGKDMAQGGTWRRSTSRSVEFETSSGWLEPSNVLQSTGIHLDVEFGLMAVDGCYSIGVGKI
jgi:hypothetical protein